MPEWAVRLSITFVVPQLSITSVSNLLAAAGLIQGVGDWRPEKGSGNFGQFTLTTDTDEEYRRIIDTGGRAAQIDAMANPVAYDDEAESMLSWFDAEVDRRGKVVSIK